MKKLTLTIFSIAIAMSASAQKLDRSIRPKPGPAPEVKLGDAQSFTLPNGLRVFVVEKHKLPVVSCSIQLDIRPELEGNAAGYREMMSELLLSGTKTRSNDKLNEQIDFIGVNINASDDGIYASGLNKHFATMLELMSDITMNSDFKQSELDKIKKRTLSGLEAAKNEPDNMLQNVSAVVNFGRQHPYGEVPTDATVNNITLDKVKKYYSTYFRPNVTYMAIVGDITFQQAKVSIEKHFGNWAKANVPVAKYADPSTPKNTQVAFVPRDGAVQSVINVTYALDLQPGTPDVIKAKVANSILGGGSNGRLFLNLREKHGWTYGSYSSISQDELKGTFTAYAKCRNAVSDSSVNEILAEMRKLKEQPVPQDELQNHLNSMSGSFAMSLESPQTVAQYAINIERYKMPKDYYQNYLKNLNAVTATDVQAMADKYINAGEANIVVVGNKGDVDKTLVKFDADGKLDYYDNFGNTLKEKETKAAPAGITAAEVMKKYIAAIGGEKAVSGVKDIKTVSKGTLSMQGQEIPLTITEMKKAPNRMKSMVEGMGMVFSKQVFDGTKGYAEQQGQRKEMTAEELESVKEQADIAAELHPEKHGITRTVKGMEKVNNTDAYLVEAVNKKGDKTTEYYDTKTGFLIRKVEIAEGATQTIDYGDYKEVPGAGGYKIAYSMKLDAGGMVIPAKIETAEINKGIPDTEFN